MKVVFIFLFSSLTMLHSQSFTDISEITGSEVLSQGEGISVVDYNNDGWEDFYISNPAGKNSLYHNAGGGIFQEVSAQYGLDIDSRSKTAVWGDFNNDGFKDLYVGNQDGSDQLFLNQEGEVFVDVSTSAGIHNSKLTQCVNLVDINGDGYLDIYVSNFLSENKLFLNNGNMTFANYIFLSGALDAGKSMAGLFFDYDQDGDQDLYLSHDGFEKNFLYQNDGSGRFTEIAENVGADVETYGMGIEVLDVNLDGAPELYITNLFRNTLLMNNGSGLYEDVAEDYRVDDSGMSWGTVVLDYNSDGREDIYVANDFNFTPEKSMLFTRSTDTFSTLDDISALANEESNFGVAKVDLENDGDVDLIITNKSSYSRIIRNDTEQGKYVNLKLVGTESNRDAIGASVTWVENDSLVHRKEVRAGSGWTSQSTSILHFSLGEEGKDFAASILWPSGRKQDVKIVELDRLYTIVEGQEPQEGNKFLITSSTYDEGISQALSIHPNPAYRKFTVVSQGIEEVKLYTMLGQLIDATVQFTDPSKASVAILESVHSQNIVVRIRTNDQVITKVISFLDE